MTVVRAELREKIDPQGLEDDPFSWAVAVACEALELVTDESLEYQGHMSQGEFELLQNQLENLKQL